MCIVRVFREKYKGKQESQTPRSLSIIKKVEEVGLCVNRILVTIKLPSIIEDTPSQLKFWNNVGRCNALVKRLKQEN